jgi:hypothetical protein
VTTSSRTLLSTRKRVTRQRHDLIGAHARAGGTAQGGEATATPPRVRRGFGGDDPLPNWIVAPIQHRSAAGAGGIADLDRDGDLALALIRVGIGDS